MSQISLRRATPDDVGGLTRLVQAAYGHYVERLGGPPRPLVDDYAEVVADRTVTVAERDGTFFIAQAYHCAVGTKPG